MHKCCTERSLLEEYTHTSICDYSEKLAEKTYKVALK
jgi:hypothetical protein